LLNRLLSIDEHWSGGGHNQGDRLSFGLEGVLSFWGCLLDVGLWGILVKLHKLRKIELGLLEDLDLSDHAAVFLKWEDFGRALFLNLFANISFNQDFDEVFESGFLNTGLHDLHHLLSDKLLLGCLSVASGLHLSWCLLCETDREHSHDVTIRGLSLGKGLNKGVPFLDHSTSVITSDVHTMEVGVAVESLDFIDLELELSPGGADLWVWCIAIVKGDLDDTTPETFTRLLKTGSLVARHQSHNSFIKSWGQHIVPLFTGEWMGFLLLGTLLFEVSWVLSSCH